MKRLCALLLTIALLGLCACGESAGVISITKESWDVAYISFYEQPITEILEEETPIRPGKVFTGKAKKGSWEMEIIDVTKRGVIVNLVLDNCTIYKGQDPIEKVTNTLLLYGKKYTISTPALTGECSIWYITLS